MQVQEVRKQTNGVVCNGVIRAYCPNKPKQVIIRGSVEGKPVKWMTDLGSDVTIIASRLVAGKPKGRIMLQVASRQYECNCEVVECEVEVEGLKMKADIVKLKNPCQEATLG